MFESVTAAARVEVHNLVRTIIWAAVGASMTLVGVMFLAVTTFIRTFESCGPLWAAVSMIIYFFAVAGIAVATLLFIQNKARKDAAKQAETETVEQQEREQGAPPLWRDPGVISAALPVALKVGQVAFRNRAMIGVVASTAVVGYALLRGRYRDHGGTADPSS